MFFVVNQVGSLLIHFDLDKICSAKCCILIPLKGEPFNTKLGRSVFKLESIYSCTSVCSSSLFKLIEVFGQRFYDGVIG